MISVHAAGQVVGDWVLEERLGEGGFGEVWRARPRDGKSEDADVARVAVKIARDPARARSLAREGRLLEGLDHPGIVRTFAVHADADPPHLVLELVRGRDLRRLLDDHPGRQLAWHVALPIVAQVADALAAAHARGVVHGDVKPANVLLREDEDGGVALTDFGLGLALEAPGGLDASLASRSLAGDERALRGTLAYLAPECRRGEKATPRADVYALGVLLHETLVGHPPRGVLRTLAERGVEDAPPALDELLRDLLQPDPDRRPADASEVAGRLAGLEGATARRRCPDDGAELRVATIDGTPIDRCRQCGGTWFDPGEMRAVIRAMVKTACSVDLREPPSDAPAGARLPCLVCGEPMAAQRLVLLRPALAGADEHPVGEIGCCSGHGRWLPASGRAALVRVVERWSDEPEAPSKAPAPIPAPTKRVGRGGASARLLLPKEETLVLAGVAIAVAWVPALVFLGHGMMALPAITAIATGAWSLLFGGRTLVDSEPGSLVPFGALFFGAQMVAIGALTIAMGAGE